IAGDQLQALFGTVGQSHVSSTLAARDVPVGNDKTLLAVYDEAGAAAAVVFVDLNDGISLFAKDAGGKRLIIRLETWIGAMEYLCRFQRWNGVRPILVRFLQESGQLFLSEFRFTTAITEGTANRHQSIVRESLSERF